MKSDMKTVAGLGSDRRSTTRAAVERAARAPLRSVLEFAGDCFDPIASTKLGGEQDGALRG